MTVPADPASTEASSASASELPHLVIGGGVSGLTVAYHLHRSGQPVRVLEASGRLGGTIRTLRHDGFVYDAGPDSFLKTKPHGVQLCETLGIADELMSPRREGGTVYVAYDGALHPMPEGLALGVPTRVEGLLNTPLLSGPGKLRALMEPFVPTRGDDGEETIGAFLSRRLGAEMAERLAAPLLAGVFAGDAGRLSMQATFPQLVALEKKHGSLFRGMTGGKPLLSVLLRKRGNPPNPFVTLRAGLGRLIDRLEELLPEDSIVRHAHVDHLEPLADGTVQVRVGKETLHARHVTFAGPPWSAAPLLGELDEGLGEALSEVRGNPTATVFFGLEAAAVQRSLSGSGFIVPPGEGQILASTWTSSKWEDRAPAGAALVRAFLGGARKLDITQLSDAELERIAHEELTRLMGELGPIRFTRVCRYARGTPQPELGHLQRLERINERLALLPFLSLTGSGYGGTGIPDCVRMAQGVAASLVEG